MAASPARERLAKGSADQPISPKPGRGQAIGEEEKKAMQEPKSTKSNKTQEAQAAATLAGKYLTFGLGQEEYGIGILKIKEIIGMMPINELPQTPPFIKGVINLRGKVIPITDLRMKFGLESMDYTDRTCIIVVEMEKDSQSLIMGLVVDAVSEVANIKNEEIETTPHLGVQEQIDFVQGMAKLDSGVKILLDIDRVLGGEQVSALKEMF
jgi:purine-binding chemotaxis protein CheW